MAHEARGAINAPPVPPVPGKAACRGLDAPAGGTCAQAKPFTIRLTWPILRPAFTSALP